MLAGTLEPGSAGPFLFAEKRCLIFPHQEKPKAKRASENGLGDNNGRPAYYFCSQVDVFSLICLSGVCLSARASVSSVKPDAVYALLAQVWRGAVERMSTYRKQGVLLHASGD